MSEWHEPFLVEFSGGPIPGKRLTDDSVVSWPLPESIVLAEDGGEYVRTSMSILGPQTEDSYVVRGATYRWKPNR